MIEGRKILRKQSALVILLAVVGCEGPMGPSGEQGPRGPQGPPGPQGQVDEGTFIHVGNLSLALYDGFGRIIVEDRRISPKTFRGIFVRVSLDDPNYTAFFKPPHFFDMSISEGKLIVHDDGQLLINYLDHLKGFSIERDGVTTASFEDATFTLMVLVTT